jgi:hypothetical protein
MRLLGLGAVVAAVIIVIVAGYALRDQLSGSVQNLKVGDCFEVPATDEVRDVQHRPCSQPHDGEVFVVQDFGDGDAYPSTTELQTWASEHCLGAAFEAYVGAAYESRDDITVGYLYPLEEGWQQGSRAMTCYLSPADGGAVSESYRASGS